MIVRSIAPPRDARTLRAWQGNRALARNVFRDFSVLHVNENRKISELREGGGEPGPFIRKISFINVHSKFLSPRTMILYYSQK